MHFAQSQEKNDPKTALYSHFLLIYKKIEKIKKTLAFWGMPCYNIIRRQEKSRATKNSWC